MLDIYIASQTYERAVARIRDALAHEYLSDEQRHGAVEHLLAGLGIADHGRVEHLLDALLDLEASPVTGEFDECDVKLVLGERGNVWPAHLRQPVAPRASASPL